MASAVNRLRCLLVICGIIVLGSPMTLPMERIAAAVTYTVNATSDTGAGSGTTGDLRYVITQVNAGSGGDTITITATGTITLMSALPALAKDVTISGLGAGLLAVDGKNAVTVFHVNSGVTASIGGLTVQHGIATVTGCLLGYQYDACGGGIYNDGTLTLTNATLTGNHANYGAGSHGGYGGGIYNNISGTVTVTNSSITSNSADYGGGIYTNNGGTLTVTNSTVSDNGSGSGGGGIYNNNACTLTMANSTISGNYAGFDGGDIYNNNSGWVTVTNSTISGNKSNRFGGGIFNDGGGLIMTNSTIAGNGNGYGGGIDNGGTMIMTNSTLTGNLGSIGGGIMNSATVYNGGRLTVTNTIVAANTATNGSPDIDGAVTTTSHNVIGTTRGSTGITNGVNGDIVNPTPLLGTLGNYGGPTQTMPLLVGSPAIGAGDPTVCAKTTDTYYHAPVAGKDQRGFSRPAAACAIGAFEPQPPTPLPAARSGGVTGGASPNPLPSGRGSNGSGGPNPLPPPRT